MCPYTVRVCWVCHAHARCCASGVTALYDFMLQQLSGDIHPERNKIKMSICFSSRFYRGSHHRSHLPLKPVKIPFWLKIRSRDWKNVFISSTSVSTPDPWKYNCTDYRCLSASASSEGAAMRGLIWGFSAGWRDSLFVLERRPQSSGRDSVSRWYSTLTGSSSVGSVIWYDSPLLYIRNPPGASNWEEPIGRLCVSVVLVATLNPPQRIWRSWKGEESLCLFILYNTSEKAV